MFTTLNPLLLAALLAPTDKKGNPINAIVQLAGPYLESAPKRPVIADAAAKVLQAFIDMEEVSEGWHRAGKTNPELVQAIRMRAADLNLRPEGTSWDDAAQILFEIGEGYIEAHKAYDKEYYAYADRARLHALLAPRIAYAEALLRQVPGTVTAAPEIITNFGPASVSIEVPEHLRDVFAEMKREAEQDVPAPVREGILGGLARANAAQGLPATSLKDLAEAWHREEAQRAEAAAVAGAENVENYLRHTAACFKGDFAELLSACKAEGIQYMLKLREDEKQAVETGKAFHQVQSEVIFSVETDADCLVKGSKGIPGRRIVVIQYRAPSTLAVEGTGEFKFSTLGATYFAPSAETIGRLAAKLQKDLLSTFA